MREVYFQRRERLENAQLFVLTPMKIEDFLSFPWENFIFLPYFPKD